VASTILTASLDAVFFVTGVRPLVVAVRTWFSWDTSTMSVFASRPLVFSTLLHASLAGILLAWMLRMQREPVPMPVIMEWVPAAPSQSASPEAPTTVRTTAPAVNFTPLPVPVPARTRVAEAVVRATQAQSSAPVRTSVSARPAPVRTTFAEHRRRNPVVATTPAVSGQAPAASRINIDDVLAGPRRSGPVPAEVADPAVDAGYWAALLGKLRAVHQKPAELDDGLSVRVEFMLRADGSVGDVRILTSSGSTAFDASVVAAFRRISGLGPPPSGKAGVNQVTFRTRME
jgi:TonB family protein